MANFSKRISTEEVLQIIMLDSGSESNNESDDENDKTYENDSDSDGSCTSVSAQTECHGFGNGIDLDETVNRKRISTSNLQQEWIEYGFYDDYSPNWLPDFVQYNQRRHHGILIDKKPLDFLLMFFPPSLFDLISHETNRYADRFLSGKQLTEHSRYKRWTETTPLEIRAFTALQMCMGLCNKFSLNDYWNKYWLTYTPFCKVMSRDRFILLSAFFHLSDSSTYISHGQPGYDPLHKVLKLFDIVDPLYIRHYVPNKCLSIDESMVGFKGRIDFRQYMPAKPTKWGMKEFVLCDSRSGYHIKSIIYTGKDSFIRSKDTPLTEDVVLKLIDGFENKGHILYMDNFYSAPRLFQHLKELGIGACGTVKSNRQGMPKKFKTAILKKGDDLLFMRNDNMVACLWHDTKKVTLLSTVHTDNTVDKKIRSRENGGGYRTVDKPVIDL